MGMAYAYSWGGMMFATTIRIERPVADVFAFVADLENLPKWNHFVTDVRKTSVGSVGVGTTYHQMRKMDQQDLQIVSFDRGRMLELRTVPPSKPELERRLDFQADNSATKIINRWKLDTGNPGFSRDWPGEESDGR